VHQFHAWPHARALLLLGVVTLASALLGPLAPPAAAAGLVPSTRWTAGHVVAGSSTGSAFVVRPTRTGRYLVTVGGATADLVLSVSDSAGRVVARSDHHGARAFEQVLPRLVAGRRYVVRVTSRDRAAAGFAVRVMRLRSGVYILDRGRIQPYSATYLNSSDIVGQVVNNTRRWRTFESAPTFRFWSRSGARLAGSGLFALTRPSLPPHSLTAFNVIFTPRGWWRAAATLPPATPTPKPRLAPASWYSLRIAPSVYGGMGYTLTNRTTTHRLGGQPRLVAYGSRGQVVDVDSEDWSGQGGRFGVAPTRTQLLRMSGNQTPIAPISWTDRAAVVTYD
jgi:hypothetical protein